jgi:DNA topoisomerase II
MPLWSLTLERLEKLKQAIANKKQEHDDLEQKSEKDLWCDDLDAFSEEWARHEEEELKNATKIRRMGRRASKKIGAGTTTGRKRVKNEDEDFEPGKKTKAKPKATAVKVEPKSSQRFAEIFSAKPKPKEPEAQPEPEPRVVELKDDFSDDDFSALSRSKPAAKSSQISKVAQTQPEPAADAGRNKRAATAKSAKAFLIDSDSDDVDDMLGDVGAMVKGIGKTAGDDKGRVSLYAMARPQSSHDNGSETLPKLKTKPSKKFDMDSADETNYEMLANSSPYKSASKDNKLVDDLLSDDDEPIRPAAIKASVKAAVAAPEPKKRGRPAAAATKPKAKEVPKPKAAPKSTALSPAAKAYAAKKKSAEDDSDDEMAEADSPPPRPAARGRPGRAAAAKRPVIVDEDSSMMATEEEEESDDPFDMDDD